MPRYHFHVKDGYTSLDEQGIELPGLTEARNMAVTHSGELLKDGASAHLWSGEPWFLWVTEDSKGEGEIVLKLQFSASVSGPSQG